MDVGSHISHLNSILPASLMKPQSNKHLLNEQFKWQSHCWIIRTVQLFVGCLYIQCLTELQVQFQCVLYVGCVCIVVFFERWTQATAMTVWKFISRFQQKCYRWCNTKFLWQRFVELNQSMPNQTKSCHSISFELNRRDIIIQAYGLIQCVYLVFAFGIDAENK